MWNVRISYLSGDREVNLYHASHPTKEEALRDIVEMLEPWLGEGFSLDNGFIGDREFVTEGEHEDGVTSIRVSLEEGDPLPDPWYSEVILFQETGGQSRCRGWVHRFYSDPSIPMGFLQSLPDSLGIAGKLREEIEEMLEDPDSYYVLQIEIGPFYKRPREGV